MKIQEINTEDRVRNGDRFSKLVVIEKAENSQLGNKWKCRCDCGKTCTVLENNLLNGHTKSCGCIKSPDRAGQRFGHLTVVSRTDLRSKRGKRTVPLWKCRCDCGNDVYRAMDSLTSNKNCMCKACMDQEKMKKMWENAGRVEGTQIGKITNMTISAANTSGARGVYLEKKTGRWRARIRFKGKIYSLGTYTTFEDAVKARQRGEEEIFGSFLEGLENKKEV